jgi:nicotinamidase-related amidase
MNTEETTSSDQELDPRIKAILEKYHRPDDCRDAELAEVLRQLEHEAYFAESCAGEQFLRNTARRSIVAGDTVSANFTLILAETMKKVREARFPDLAEAIKKNSN